MGKRADRIAGAADSRELVVKFVIIIYQSGRGDVFEGKVKLENKANEVEYAMTWHRIFFVSAIIVIELSLTDSQHIAA